MAQPLCAIRLGLRPSIALKRRQQHRLREQTPPLFVGAHRTHGTLPLRVRLLLALLMVAALGIAPRADAQTVWSGLTKTFTKTSFSDYTLPKNQDVLTENVVLTRGDTGGLINLAAESGFFAPISPALTQWATDINNPEQTIAATNWQNLQFTSWLDAYGGQGTRGAFIPNRNAVVYLTEDEVYLDMRFSSWVATSGGGYSYMRAEPPVTPTPTGDYNGDGSVDAADYVLWRKTLNQSASPAGSGADGNANGTIDAGDYDFWRERFGDPVSGLGAGMISVPEPSVIPVSLQLLVVLLCIARFGRRIK